MIWNGGMSALAARVEEVCLNAWPAPQELHYDGWLIRLADGQTRRSNSVNVLRDGMLPVEEKIDYCERVYRGHGDRILLCRRRSHKRHRDRDGDEDR